MNALELTDKQLCIAYEGLVQGAVCLDEHLLQGVWVYVESAMLARNIARETYLRIEHLQSPQCYVRMSSLMPIDFFGTNDNPKNDSPCRDANFKPIVLKVCELISHEDAYPEQRWHIQRVFTACEVASAIEALLALLADTQQFPSCSVCELRYPRSFLDSDRICEDCCYELLGGE